MLEEYFPTVGKCNDWATVYDCNFAQNFQTPT